MTTDSSQLQVNVHSRLTVVSCTPTEPIGEIRSLTPIDRAMGSHTVHIIFYYRTKPFSRQGRYAMDLDNVRLTLSNLLSKYPKMTGRLVRDGDGNWEVKCNDAGVRMYKASVGVSIDEWFRLATESDERSLSTWEDMPDGDPISWSPFQIQVSEFMGGGLAIGLSFTHLLADPTSGTLFYKSWTDVERGEEPIDLHSPIFDLPPSTTLNNHNSTTTKYLQTRSQKPPFSSTKMSTFTFKFSNSIIQQNLSKIADKCPEATPFDYLTALFWSRIVKNKTISANSRTRSISLCVDARKHLDVPIPTKFFGNALSFSHLCLDNEILVSDNGLAQTVESVHRHVNGIKKEDIVSMIDWVESCSRNSVQMYGPELTCVSLEHLLIPKDDMKDGFVGLVYEAKFRNNENPVHVSYRVGNADGEGLMIVAPSPEGGMARAVILTLPAEEIEKLCGDPVIMEMEPTMVLSGKR